MAVLQEHGHSGPLRNEEKSKELRDRLYEFKSRGKERILYFYPSNLQGVTILTHGFTKEGRKTPKQEL